MGADTIEKSICISTDPDDHARFVRQHADLGFDHVIVHTAGPDQRAFIRAYGREVRPRLGREAVAR